MTTMNTAPTILIVDDTPSNLSVVVNLFEDSGYRVYIAQDGEEGLQRAGLVLPNLILLDVMMPGVDGFETCRRLKAQEATRDIPVIFMTSLASVEHKVNGFQAGAVDYLAKPLQIEEVMARVDTHLKLHAAQKKLAAHNDELERRVAERTAELAASESEFRTLVENAPDEIARHDRQCRYFYINPQHERTLGLALADLAGKAPEECFPGSPDVAAYQALMAQVIETGRSVEYEATLPGIGDGPRYHSILLVAERDSAGGISGVLSIGRDITERKRSEQQLAMLGAAMAKMHEAAYFVDDQARIFYVNDEASRQLGYSRDEFLGMTVMDIAPGWTKDMVVNAWQGLGENEAITFEAEHRCKDGSTIAVEISATHLNHAGKAFGLSMVRDITEQKRAERELHLLNRALDNTFDATYLVDSDLRLRYVNEAAVRTLGYSHEELLSMSLLDIDPNITREMVNGLMQQTAASGRFPGTVESRHRRKNGEMFPIEVGATTFSYEGETLFLTVVRDISERKRVERELMVLNSAVNTSSDAAFLMNEQGRFVYVNDSACKSLGYSREELLGMSPLDIDPNITEETFRKMRQALFSAELSSGIMETRHRTRDGHIFPVELAASVLELEGALYSLAMVRDITERKESERRLHEKSQAIHAVVENSPDTIIRYDKQCRRIYLNPAMEKVFGQPREQLHGTSPSEFSPLPAHYLATIKKVLESGSEQRMESSFCNAEGETCWVDLRLAPEFDAEGKVATVLAIGRDISERKRAEEELAEREQRYREIFDNAVEGMYLLEVTEDGRFRNLDINPALAASTGIPRETMVGQFVDDTVPEEMGKRIVEKYRRCVAAGTTISEHIELDLPAGRNYYYSTITPIYYGGRVHRLIGISRDITDLMKAERELQESREQLRGLTARREAAREEERKYIAREVHDELGQVLTGLQLNISVLEHKFTPDLPPLREHLKETKVLTDRALGVARNVASALRPAALDLGINSALEWLVGRFSTNTGIQCKVHLSPEEIHIDESHAMALFRIVQESLTNISRHAQASRVDVTFDKDEEGYLLTVRDNGKGFEADARKLDSYGLVGIKERALMLGGKVIIESNSGKGTQISVRLPINQTGEA